MTNWTKVELTKKQITLSVVFIVAILVTLGLRIYFYDLALRTPAPDYLVANDHVAAIAYNEHLYVLDHEGSLISKTPFSQADIRNDIVDMQLLDSETIALADWGKKQILKCEVLTLACSPLSVRLDKHLGYFFKFHYRDNFNDILLSDTDRHRILHYDIEAEKITKVSTKKQFIYPNHLQMENDELLYITDTNHHEISRFKLNENKLIKQGESISVPSNVSKLKWPIYYYRLDNGNMFVLQGNNFLEKPDLVFFEKGQKPRVIPTRFKSDITVLAKMGNQLLMTDRYHFKVYALNLTSMELKEFGDIVFKAELAKGKSDSDKWSDLADSMLYLMIAIVVGLVAFIIILALTGKPTPDKHFLNREFDADTISLLPSIPAGEIVWLKKNPAFRYLLPGLFFVFVGMLGLVYWAFSELVNAGPTNNLDDESFEELIAAGLILGGIIIMTFSMAFLNLYYRIGTDGKLILFKRFSRIFEADPRDVLYTVQYIQFGNQTFTYQNNLKSNFHDAAEFKYYITPLLNNFATKVKTHTILLNMLKRPNLYTIVSLSGFIIITTSFFIYFGEDVFARFLDHGN